MHHWLLPAVNDIPCRVARGYSHFREGQREEMTEATIESIQAFRYLDLLAWHQCVYRLSGGVG